MTPYPSPLQSQRGGGVEYGRCRVKSRRRSNDDAEIAKIRCSGPVGTLGSRPSREVGITLKEEIKAGRTRWRALSFYQRFEHAVVLVLIALIAIVVLAAVWSLAVKILFGLVLSGRVDPTDPAVFQTVFGMIFTVIIALEFKRSLQIVTEHKDTVVQVRSVILIAMLAIVRKLIILDLAAANAAELFGLAVAILALGAVYWLVRDQDTRARS
jgi:uncharacterized membrane protein (DUF373 family)